MGCTHESVLISSMIDFCSSDKLTSEFFQLIIFGYILQTKFFKNKILVCQVKDTQMQEQLH